MMIRLLYILSLISMAVIASPASPVLASEPGTSGASSEQVQALQALQKLDQRLHNIGFQLATTNSVWCKDATVSSGILLHDIEQYGDKVAAREAFGFSTPITVNAVAEGYQSHYYRRPPGSPTLEKFKPGDGLLSVSGLNISDIPKESPESAIDSLFGIMKPINNAEIAQEEPEYRRIAAINQLLSSQLRHRMNFRRSMEVIVGVLREGKEIEIPLAASYACPSRFQVRPDSDMQAYADGRTVTISSALVEYVASDDELAAIAAHELSHNLLKHKERLNAQDVNRGFFGQFGKSAGRIKETEIEADRLSIWLMVNAGYSPQAAISFWSRYGKEHGKGIFSASTHYRWKKRVKLFEEEIAKIALASKDRYSRYRPPLLDQNNDSSENQ